MTGTHTYRYTYRAEMFTECQEVKVEAVKSGAQKHSYFSCLWLPFTCCSGGVVFDRDDSACKVGSCVDLGELTGSLEFLIS